MEEKMEEKAKQQEKEIEKEKTARKKMEEKMEEKTRQQDQRKDREGDGKEKEKEHKEKEKEKQKENGQGRQERERAWDKDQSDWKKQTQELEEKEERMRRGREDRSKAEGQGTKRPLQKSPTRENNKRGKVSIEGFVGDSHFKPLVEDPGLQYTAYYQNWQVRMWRGCKMRDVVIMAEEAIAEEWNRIYICGGSNDVVKMEGGVSEKIETEVLDPLQGIVRKLKEAGTEPVLVIPPPRRSKDGSAQATLRKGIKGVAEKEGCAWVDMGVAGYDYRTHSKDEVHMRHEWFREALVQMLTKAGHRNINLAPQQKLFDGKMLYGNLCWKCGVPFCRAKTCQTETRGCRICQSKGHTEATCLARVKMCTTCGIRGHIKPNCNTHRN
jgi:hypothetical protein